MKHPTLFCLLFVTLSACQRKAAEAPAPAEVAAKTVAPVKPETVVLPPFVASSFEAPGRIVAVGDIHGDWDAMVRALVLAGVIDADGTWVGGDTTLVQTGDVLDRGDDEQRILDFLRELRDGARVAGGQVILLNGNHEIMNVAGDLRYVTPDGFADFEGVEGAKLDAPVLARAPEAARARLAAFLPGGPYALMLADYPVIAIVDDTAFAHGGVLPDHVHYGIDRMNAETSAWMRGEQDVPVVLQSETAPIWTRIFSTDAPDCALLGQTLELLGAKRLVVGHTVQRQGITSACGGKVWRIDVGMSSHYGGQADALVIDGGAVTAASAR